MAYAVSYHAKLLYQKYGIGYGILTMQGKEAKHATIKQELKSCSNRSLSESNKNKWHQLRHGNYIRCFYLPFHYPIQLYQPHYDSRNPKVSSKVCGCYRQILDDIETCQSCCVATDYLQCIKREGRIPDIVMNVKPVVCEQCKQRFTDCIESSRHNCAKTDREVHKILPTTLSVAELKKHLSERGLPTSGTKPTLVARLESAITF